MGAFLYNIIVRDMIGLKQNWPWSYGCKKEWGIIVIIIMVIWCLDNRMGYDRLDGNRMELVSVIGETNIAVNPWKKSPTSEK